MSTTNFSLLDESATRARLAELSSAWGVPTPHAQFAYRRFGYPMLSAVKSWIRLRPSPIVLPREFFAMARQHQDRHLAEVVLLEAGFVPRWVASQRDTIVVWGLILLFALSAGAWMIDPAISNAAVLINVLVFVLGLFFIRFVPQLLQKLRDPKIALVLAAATPRSPLFSRPPSPTPPTEPTDRTHTLAVETTESED